MNLHRGELLGIEDRVLADDRVVRETRDVGDGSGGNGQRVFAPEFPGGGNVPAEQLRRVGAHVHGNVLDRLVPGREGQQQRRRIEPCERIVEIDGQVFLGVDLARKRKFEGEGILLLGFGPLLARRLGLAAFAFEALALALCSLVSDQPPRSFKSSVTSCGD